MRNNARRCALLLFVSGAACGGQELPGSPSFETVRLEPGSSFVVILGVQPPPFIGGSAAVLTTGPSSATTLFSVCGVTPSFVSPMASVPPLDGVVWTAVQVYSEQPIPAGTRLAVTHLCGVGGFGTYRAVVR
jgi:hypothetical protein